MTHTTPKDITTLLGWVGTGIFSLMAIGAFSEKELLLTIPLLAFTLLICPAFYHIGDRKHRLIASGIFIIMFLIVGIFSSPLTPEEALQISPERQRQYTIQHAFSAWDGSHRKLTEYIKNNMNDPSSYEHVRTQYKDNGEYITVITQFRRKNIFGAIVLTTMTVETDIDGTILRVISTE